MKPEECNQPLQERDNENDSAYVLHTYCDKPLEYRLGEGLFSMDNESFNLGMSDYMCMNLNPGD